MQQNFVFLFFSALIISIKASAINRDESSQGDKPLFLTQYIESGRLEEGRNLARVTPFLGNVRSYSGLLTVDKSYDSNLFFWYFPSERKTEDVPLLIWLNGYSTASSYSVFLQTGPYNYLTPEMKLREESWQNYYHVVYIDNPVGVGFSFTNSTDGYSTDLDKVGLNLQNFLEQFLMLFPDLQGRELYLTGLSLGGKYVPALAHRIYQDEKFNLKGLFLGNPFLDIDTQIHYENYLYELGFIDKNQRTALIEQQEIFKSYAKKPDNFTVNHHQFYSYINNMTGINMYDYNDVIVESKYYTEFIKKDYVRKALHVSGVSYNDGTQAMAMFTKGFINSVLGYLGDMLETVSMMFYAGQNDVSMAYPMMVDALTSINWSGQERYKVNPRTKLYKKDGRHIWGYMRKFKTLTDVMIRKAGHSAVTNQPKHVLWLLKKFTNYKRFR